jgi:hypothetical protein
MLESFVRRNVGEIDAMIARAEQRLSLHERTENDSEGAADVAEQMRAGLKRMRVYRRFVENMQTIN